MLQTAHCGGGGFKLDEEINYKFCKILLSSTTEPCTVCGKVVLKPKCGDVRSKHGYYYGKLKM